MEPFDNCFLLTSLRKKSNPHIPPGYGFLHSTGYRSRLLWLCIFFYPCESYKLYIFPYFFPCMFFLKGIREFSGEMVISTIFHQNSIIKKKVTFSSRTEKSHSLRPCRGRHVRYVDILKQEFQTGFYDFLWPASVTGGMIKINLSPFYDADDFIR